ncbi:MAG: URC4/urg3 family protein, partial [Ideonella sp.]|nr:URC4/urg3 family protein [Ideonella sp.]
MSETVTEAITPAWRRAGDPLDGLRRPSVIRARCAAIVRAIEQDLSAHWTVDRSRLPEVADLVAALTRERFPDLRVPLHSRWRHFEVGGVDRRAELDAAMAGRSDRARAEAMIDLTVVSVLLDAGAGPAWRYTERPGAVDALALPAERHSSADLFALLDRVTPSTPPVDDAAAAAMPAPAPAAGTSSPGARGASVYTRSEGLAVATLRGFMAGVFSASPEDPMRVDAQALRQVDAAGLRAMFQVGPTNPLVGLEGRAGLLARLGVALQDEVAHGGGTPRPSLLLDRLSAGGRVTRLAAGDLLVAVLRLLAPIWRTGSTVLGLPAGDVWPHRFAGAATGEPAGERSRDRQTPGVVPFHKLAQWLCYSLVEPLAAAGLQVTDLDQLTGLPEYRNGGLLLDTGVVVPRDPRVLAGLWKPGDEPIVEWRASTVVLLDELAPLVRERLGAAATDLPLAAILEGGTWAVGRRL